MNKWNEPDEHPVKRQWHVRHTIPAAEGTGYLFGKNFEKLPDALSFCALQTHARLLVHVSGEEWLRIDDQSARYFVVASKPRTTLPSSGKDMASAIAALIRKHVRLEWHGHDHADINHRSTEAAAEEIAALLETDPVGEGRPGQPASLIRQGTNR